MTAAWLPDAADPCGSIPISPLIIGSRIAYAHPVRVLIVSDTHGALDPRIAELASRAELVIHAGDVGSAEILEQLRPAAAGGQLIAVTGNNDVPGKWPRGQRRRLRDLPETAEIAVPGGVIAVEHGHRALPASRRHERLRARHPDARLVVYGHSHRLVIDRDARPWVVNPGAAGRARTFGGPSCLVLRASTRRWQIDERRFAP